MAMANDRVHPRKRKKVCSFCVDKVAHIDFKDTANHLYPKCLTCKIGYWLENGYL